MVIPSDLIRDTGPDAPLLALLRLSLEPLDLAELLGRTVELLSGWPGLRLKPGGCVYLLDEASGTLRAAARCGIADHLLLSPRELADDRVLWTRGEGGHEARFVRWEAFPEEARRSGLIPRAEVVPIESNGRRIGLLVLFAEPDAATEAECREDLLRGVADVLAGMIERRRAEELLHASEERFDLAVRGSDAGIWDWDLRTNQVYFSPRWKSMLGYQDWEIPGQFSEWENRLHPEDRQRARGLIRDYLEGRREDYEFEHRLRHRDGTYRWILARGAAVHDARGNPIRMVGSHLDVTERRRVEAELRDREARMLVARGIQQRLLSQEAPRVDGVEVAGASRPAEETGGDLFDVFELNDGELGVCVADVSGHGYESALLMATTAARIRSYLEFPLGLREVMERTNRALLRETDGERFVTMTMAWLDPKTGVLRYVNAGNPAGLVIGSDGSLRARLASESPPLAVWAETSFQGGGRIVLEPGDVVVLYTDGVLEAPWPVGDLVGEDQIVRTVFENRGRTCREIVDALFESVARACREEGPLDDLTAVVLRFSGPRREV